MATTAPSTGLALEVESLTVRAGRHVVVRDVSFTARPGTLFWITGDNGAGKSSLLRVLARQASATGSVIFHGELKRTDIAFYAPVMGVPASTTVRMWLKFNRDLAAGEPLLLNDDDGLVPPLSPKALLTKLSTGEAKRLLLWSLLRVHKPLVILDEPYEHLSPTAKARLTEILVMRAEQSVVIVATNQEVPDISSKFVLDIDEAS